MSPKSLDPTALLLYQEAATALLLWQFRLHPRPISSRAEELPDTVQGEIPFAALVAQGPVSLPVGTSMEVADRFWSANLYKAEAAALLALLPAAVERRWAPRASGFGSSTAIDIGWRATLARAAEALGVQDRPAWVRELKESLDRRLAHPLVTNGIEVLVTAAREMGTLTEHDVERFLERAGAPREPWPEWMPGEAPAAGFYFD